MQHIRCGLHICSQVPSARQHNHAPTVPTPTSLIGFQEQKGFQQLWLSSGIITSRSSCWRVSQSKAADGLARFQRTSIKSLAAPQDGVQTESESTSGTGGSDSATPRGEAAGPGPGSIMDAAIEGQSPDRDPRKIPLIQRIIQGLGWPILATTQFLGAVLNWLIPDIKSRR